MKRASEGKISTDGIIFSNELITEQQGYEAMIYMLEAYWEASGSNDLTDILSGGSVKAGKVIFCLVQKIINL
jgi:hypothetical protein